MIIKVRKVYLEITRFAELTTDSLLKLVLFITFAIELAKRVIFSICPIGNICRRIF